MNLPSAAAAQGWWSSFTYEDLTQSLLRAPDVFKSIPDVIKDPASNPLQAALLLGIFTTLVLIVLISVLLVILRPEREEYAEPQGEYEEEGGVPSVAPRPAPQGSRALKALTVASVVLLVGLLLWVAVGISSSTRATCVSCHTDNPHNTGVAVDVHGNVACVACHENGGAVAVALMDTPARLQHFYLGATDPSATVGYGQPVSSDGCRGCHKQQLGATTLDSVTGVSISHKEPLKAGAECVDCHKLSGGVVSLSGAGMAPCLRCHNGKSASADCSTCHKGDPGQAIRSSEPTSGGYAQELVADPTCGACHLDMTKCDACHGLRMPHTAEFKAGGHARPAVIDIWDNGGRTCKKCHYPSHNDCGQCHAGPFPSHGLEWKYGHTFSTWSEAASACSCHHWNSAVDGPFCLLCHPTKPATARP